MSKSKLAIFEAERRGRMFEIERITEAIRKENKEWDKFYNEKPDQIGDDVKTVAKRALKYLANALASEYESEFGKANFSKKAFLKDCGVET